jgi:hypothetical protein
MFFEVVVDGSLPQFALYLYNMPQIITRTLTFGAGRTLPFFMLLCVLGAASANTVSATTIDEAQQAAASALDVTGSFFERVRPYLARKEAELAVRIEKARAIEEATVETKTGELINAAAGDATVKAVRPTGTPADTGRRVLLQCYRGLVLVGIFLLDYKVVLYLLLAYVVYKLLRFVFNRLFTRRID